MALYFTCHTLLALFINWLQQLAATTFILHVLFYSRIGNNHQNTKLSHQFQRIG